MVPRLRPHYSGNQYRRFPLNKTSFIENASFFYLRSLKSSTRFSSSSTNSPPPPKPVQGSKERSRHASWYTDMLPGMLPIFLIAFSVYGALELTRLSLVQEKQLLAHAARIEELERQIALERTKPNTISSEGLHSGQGDKNGGTSSSSGAQKGRWWFF